MHHVDSITLAPSSIGWTHRLTIYTGNIRVRPDTHFLPGHGKAFKGRLFYYSYESFSEFVKAWKQCVA